MLERQLSLSGGETDPAAGLEVGKATSLYWTRNLHLGDSECLSAETATSRDEQIPKRGNESEFQRTRGLCTLEEYSEWRLSLSSPWWPNTILRLMLVCVHRRCDTGISECRKSLHGFCPSPLRRSAKELEAALSPDEVFCRRLRVSVREARHHNLLRLRCRRSNQ